MFPFMIVKVLWTTKKTSSFSIDWRKYEVINLINFNLNKSISCKWKLSDFFSRKFRYHNKNIFIRYNNFHYLVKSVSKMFIGGNFPSSKTFFDMHAPHELMLFTLKLFEEMKTKIRLNFGTTYISHFLAVFASLSIKCCYQAHVHVK